MKKTNKSNNFLDLKQQNIFLDEIRNMISDKISKANIPKHFYGQVINIYDNGNRADVQLSYGDKPVFTNLTNKSNVILSINDIVLLTSPSGDLTDCFIDKNSNPIPLFNGANIIGVLTVGGFHNASGAIIVQDENGNDICIINKSGITIENNYFKLLSGNDNVVQFSKDGNGNSGIELGSQISSNTPYFDFHSSGTNSDFDARIISSGGNSTAGQGTLNIEATNVQVNGVSLNSAVNGTIGYQKLVSGMIIQYGYVNIANGGTTVNFPLTFPSVCRSVIVTGVGSLAYSVVINSINQTGCKIVQTSGSTQAVYYMALGF